MKYGDTLRQRSIPEWVYNNIQYDEIKHLIKENTTPGNGKAVSIPGKGNNAEREFEKRLFDILREEHDGIGLFVKSKNLEIQRRLEHLDRKLRTLQLRIQSGAQSLKPARVSRYGRLEQEAISTGEEIRSLSRYIGAQRLAFTKLLKKYKKWTGSDALEIRFKSEVLGKPTSFTKISLGAQLDAWTDILQIIRAASNPDPTAGVGSPLGKSSPFLRPQAPPRPREHSASIAAQLARTIALGSDVGFDAALADAPIGESGTKAVYWIHKEQLIELQVVLLQLLRLYLPKSRSGTPSSSQSPVITRRSSVSCTNEGPVDKDIDFGIIVLDQIEDYAKRLSRSTVSDSEDSNGRSFEKPSAIARWTTGDEAIISMRHLKDDGSAGVARVQKKHLGALLNVDRDFLPWKNPEPKSPVNAPNPASRDEMSADDARALLNKHREIQPLVGILSNRTRFIGLENTSSAGQWCVLDSQISVGKISLDDLVGKNWVSNISRDATEFPYAVLRVRQEGKVARSITNILDKSHLTERVRGFSLTSHAIWACWKPKSMSPPFWLPVLQRDIRKVPEATTTSRRKASTQMQTPPTQSSATSQDDGTGGSSTAVATGESSAASIPSTPTESRDFDPKVTPKRQRKVTYREDALLKQQASKAALANAPRYWSEYDHPEDGSDDENGYYIYLDPNISDKFFGQETAEDLYAKLRGLFNRREQHEPKDEESRPLLTTIIDEDEESSSPTDTDDENAKNGLLKPRQYSTMPHNGAHRAVAAARRFSHYSVLLATETDTLAPANAYRLLITSLTLASSLVICVIVATLATTGRKRQRGEVDAGVLFGVVASLFFALVGMINALTSREGMNYVKWGVVAVVFCAVCIADGAVIGMIV